MLIDYCLAFFFSMHVAVFVDISPWQRHPLTKLHYLLVAVLAAFSGLLLALLWPDAWLQYRGVAMVFLACVLALPLTLNLKKLLPFDWDW